MMAPIPFHAGEREAQRRAGVSLDGAPIRDFMPDQHRAFFSLLPFLPAASVGEDGFPAATVLTGRPGFISSPDPRTLVVQSPPPSDGTCALVEGAPVGVLGIDLATRRRNRANGRIVSVTPSGFAVAVEQSFGNCPKYIQTRDLVPAAAAAPGVVERLNGLDDAARDQIRAADTVFVASFSGDVAQGGVDMSHRGGRPGFVRVEGNRLTIPDFSGNRYFNTLGNFVRLPRAALLFIDFAGGDLLHLDGTVTIDWQPPPGYAGAQRLWSVDVRSGRRCRGAFGLRGAVGEVSPATLGTGIWP